MSSYIMSIDQGTTSTRVCLINQAGGLVAQASEAYKQIYPKPGWVEHDPEDIWQSTVKTMKAVLEQSGISSKEIAAIGITNQRETVMMWDHSGKTIYNAIVWQCRRTQDFCNKLKKSKHAKEIRKITGLEIDPYFSASKMNWLLKNISGAKKKAQAGELFAGTVDTFLLWKLTDGEEHKTDVSNASRTMLMNLKSCTWEPKLLKIFSIPFVVLPEICASSGLFGKTKNLGFLPDGIPITGIAGDQQAALFGQACFKAGEAKCTFGTGSFLLMNTGHKVIASKAKLLTTVAWQLQNQKPTYAVEGGAFICGAAVQWLRDGLQLFKKSSEVEELAASVEDTSGVEFVPALTGMGAPHWKSEARGIIIGLTRGTTKAHIARATLEAMALQNVEILLAMQKDLGRKLTKIKVDGGAAANNLLMTLQADYLGVNVERPQIVETTAMGAAFLAGLGVGFWKNLEEIQSLWKRDKEFIPNMKSSDRKNRLSRWTKAVQKL